MFHTRARNATARPSPINNRGAVSTSTRLKLKREPKVPLNMSAKAWRGLAPERASRTPPSTNAVATAAADSPRELSLELQPATVLAAACTRSGWSKGSTGST